MHRLALFADIFSTALFVSPVDIALKMMRETSGLAACIILRDGTIHKSADFTADFYTQ
jgi:thiamine biosynthesis lipoprotein ApbE